MASSWTCSRTVLRCAWAFAGLAILCVIAVILIWPRYVRSRTVFLELNVREYGRVLYLFASDNGRMPSDADELFSLGYLSRNPNGTSSPGPRARDREGPISVFYWNEIEFPANLEDSIGVAWGDRTQDAYIWMKVHRYSLPAEILAQRYSRVLKEKLLGDSRGSDSIPEQ